MKILVFDSGIGGLPIANSIHNKIPNIDIIYYQDTINNPYGNKTDEESYTVDVSWTYTDDQFADYQTKATLVFIHDDIKLSLVELQ